MIENERRASPKSRWTRRYMWLAYGGGVLALIAVVVVVLATRHGDDEMVVIYPSTALASHQPTPTINPAELEDVQFIADTKGITLDEAIARYAWQDDFSMIVTAIEDDDPDSVVDVAITGGSSAYIELLGSISGRAEDAIDKFKSDYPHVEIRVKTGDGQGLAIREVDEAVIGAHYAVLAEDGVQDGVTYYDHDTNEIVVTVQMATPPSDEKLSSLEKAAERGAIAATRPDITDSLTISLSVVQHDLSGTDDSRAPN